MVVYNWFHFCVNPDNTNLDICTFAVKRDSYLLKYVDKAIINQVIDNAGLKGEKYDIIKSGNRDAIIKLIYQRYKYFWCIKLIRQDEFIINKVITITSESFRYIDWSLVPYFYNKRIIKEKLRNNLSCLQYVDPTLIVNIIDSLGLLQIHRDLDFIVENDPNKLNSLIKKYGKYDWGIKFVNQNEKLCIKSIKKCEYNYQFVKNKTNKIQLALISKNPSFGVMITNQNRPIKLHMIKAGCAITNVKKQNIEICTYDHYMEICTYDYYCSNTLFPKLFKRDN